MCVCVCVCAGAILLIAVDTELLERTVPVMHHYQVGHVGCSCLVPLVPIGVVSVFLSFFAGTMYLPYPSKERKRERERKKEKEKLTFYFYTSSVSFFSISERHFLVFCALRLVTEACG